MPSKSSGTAPQTIDAPSQMRQLNIRITPDAFTILEQNAPTRKSWGMYISQLLGEERARQEERKKHAVHNGSHAT